MDKESIIFVDENLMDVKVDNIEDISLYLVKDVESKEVWHEIFLKEVGYIVRKEVFDKVKNYLEKVKNRKLVTYKTYAVNIMTNFGKDKLVLYNTASLSFRKYRNIMLDKIVLYEMDYRDFDEKEGKTYILSKDVYEELINFFNS